MVPSSVFGQVRIPINKPRIATEMKNAEIGQVVPLNAPDLGPGGEYSARSTSTDPWHSWYCHSVCCPSADIFNAQEHASIHV